MLTELRDLYAYNRWADHRLLAAASELAPEDYVRHLGGSFPSVKDMLIHILSAKWIWLARWQGEPSAQPLPADWDLTQFDDLRRHWEEIEQEERAFLESLSNEDLQRSVLSVTRTGLSFALPLWQTLRHAANHETYHRGQGATLLRQLGVQPPATDLFLFYVEQASAPGPG